jgi:hypothetical protein
MSCRPCNEKNFAYFLDDDMLRRGKPEGFVGRSVPAQEGDWSVQENIEDGQAECDESAVVKEQRQTTQHVQQQHSAVVCKNMQISRS